MPSLKQSPVLLYLIMLLGFVLGFLYNNQVDPTADVPQVPAQFQLTSLQGLQNLKIDYSLLASDQFKQLRIFGQLPVQVTDGGKTDPFQ